MPSLQRVSGKRVICDMAGDEGPSAGQCGGVGDEARHVGILSMSLVPQIQQGKLEPRTSLATLPYGHLLAPGALVLVWEPGLPMTPVAPFFSLSLSFLIWKMGMELIPASFLARKVKWGKWNHPTVSGL